MSLPNVQRLTIMLLTLGLLERHAATDRRSYTKNTIADRDALLRKLEIVRKRGYGVARRREGKYAAKAATYVACATT
jgi:DNA-binding IclR family transcriptional regulator